MEEVDGETEAFKTGTEIKILYWEDLQVELQSSDSELDENNKNIMFVSCHVGRTARNNQRSTFYIEHVLILTHSPSQKEK